MTIFEIDQKIKELKKEHDDTKGPEISVYSRICGYHRAINAWNKGKREEYNNRVLFKGI